MGDEHVIDVRAVAARAVAVEMTKQVVNEQTLIRRRAFVAAGNPQKVSVAEFAPAAAPRIN
jgi:hypothetical protein